MNSKTSGNFRIISQIKQKWGFFHRPRNELREEGVEISAEHMAKFSPYRTEHLGRLGSFNLDLNKEFQPMSHKLNIE